MKKASAIIISAAMAAIMALGTGCGAAGERPEHNTQASAPAPSAAITATEIAPSDFEQYGVDENAETAYTLTATVYPVSASDKTVDWTIAWARDAVSAWVSYPVTDYVTAQAQADGSTVCIVSCLQAFGEQIEVTVTSRANENAKATCTLDYVKRIVNAPTGFAGHPIIEFDPISPNVTTQFIPVELSPYYVSDGSGHLSSGTLDDAYHHDWEIKTTPEFHEKAREVLGPQGKDSGYQVAETSRVIASKNNKYFTFYQNLETLYKIIYDGECSTQSYGLHKEELDTVYTACVDAGIPFATLTLTVTGTKSSYTVSVDLYFSSNSMLYATAQSVTMSDSNVAF